MDVPRYREAGPDRLPAALRDLVECAWHASVPAAGHRQRVLPDGCMDLLVIGGRIVVAGPDTAAHVADQQPGVVLTGLRFRPGALPGLLGVPADELRDRRIGLADVRGGEPGVPPAEMVLSGDRRSPQPAEHHLGALAALLRTTVALRGAADARLPEPLPGPALGALARGMPVAELADRLGVTSRTVHRRCRATLGYGPSVARRVLRFRIAARLLHAGVPPADVAARTGYADQPHLSREVRALSGLSPAALATTPPVSRARAARSDPGIRPASREA